MLLCNLFCLNMFLIVLLTLTASLDFQYIFNIAFDHDQKILRHFVCFDRNKFVLNTIAHLVLIKTHKIFQYFLIVMIGKIKIYFGALLVMSIIRLKISKQNKIHNNILQYIFFFNYST